MDFLFDKRELRRRIDKVYSAMKQRAKPKLWKNGKKAGHVRVDGLLNLPFTSQELWDWAVEWLGTGVIRCPYCEQIGRPANLIDLTNCVFDHKVPLLLGGTWELHNLIPICADCNNIKGSMSYEFFIILMRELDKLVDLRDRGYVIRCLRTHGLSQQFQRSKHAPAGNQQSTQPGSLLLALDTDDDF